MDYIKSLPDTARAVTEITKIGLEFCRTYMIVKGYLNHTVEKTRQLYDRSCQVVGRNSCNFY